MACSQQELSTHIVTAYIGRGDHVRGRQSGERSGREWRQAGAERGRVRYRLLEEAETRFEKLPLVEAEHPKQSLLRLLHRRLICPPTTFLVLHVPPPLPSYWTRHRPRYLRSSLSSSHGKTGNPILAGVSSDVSTWLNLKI